MADGYVGLWPIIVAPQGDSSSVPASISGGASVTGQARATAVGVAAISSAATVTFSDSAAQGFAGLWPVVGLVSGLPAFVGQLSSAAAVSGERKAVNVQTAALSSGAQVTAVDSSAGTGSPAFTGLFMWPAALQGSTTVLPWGAAAGYATVTGEGVFSVLGDYATPPRSVWELPPPKDFRTPGLEPIGGITVVLRDSAAQSGDVTGYSSLTGDRRAVIVKAPELSAGAAVTGQLRAVVVATAELVSVAQVTGVAVGVVSEVRSGALAGYSNVSGVDRSLAAGVRLGIVASYSSVSGEKASSFTQAAALNGAAALTGVNASSYPLAAPPGVISSYASVTGEGIATIIATAELEAHAVIAAVATVIALGEAAIGSYSNLSVREATLDDSAMTRSRIGRAGAGGAGRIGGSVAVDIRPGIGRRRGR